MKRSPLAVSAAALLLLTLPLSACKQASPDTEGADTAEVVTIPPVTIPDKPDDRKPTDLAPYEEGLDSLFATSTPSPAEDFTFEVSDAMTATVTGYVGGNTVVVIPDTLDGAAVTAISSGAFKDKTTVKAISVPDTVTTIGKGAFEGCKSLTSMRTPVYTCEDAPYFGALFGAATHEANGYTVPNGLATLVLTAGETVPACTFYACRSLKAVALPETVTEIGDFAFYGCQSMAYIAMGDTALTSVGRNAFTNCSALLTLDIPATVQTLGFAMLEGCAALESLTLPFAGGCRVGYTEDVGEDAPADTNYLGYIFGAADYTFTEGFLPASLISVTLLEGCGDIPANAFFECDSLRTVTLPEGVTAIGRRAFYGCKKLAEMALPDSVQSLGDDAFHGCLRLASFTGGAGLTTLGVQAFMDCVSLKTVTLPDTVTHLPNACFAGCISLVSLTADGVQTEGKQVFRHCDRLGLPWVNPECVPSETEK